MQPECKKYIGLHLFGGGLTLLAWLVYLQSTVASIILVWLGFIIIVYAVVKFGLFLGLEGIQWFVVIALFIFTYSIGTFIYLLLKYYEATEG